MNALKSYLMSTDDVVIVSTILLFILFTFVLYRSRMVLLYRSRTFFSSRQVYAANEISTSKEELVDILLLILIGCLSVSAIFHQDFMLRVPGVPNYGLLLLVFALSALLILFKTALYSFVGWIFFPYSRGSGWLSAFIFSVAIVSAFAFPLALFSIYTPSTLFNVMSCLVWIVIMQKILLLCKLFVNFRPKRYGTLLFFLYFCSVEMLPTLMVWHFLRDLD